MIDKACQELEMELRKLLPEAQKLDDRVLVQATLAMNSKLRRKESITAYEMHTARRMESGTNLQLSDVKLRRSQLDARMHQPPSQGMQMPKPGDTVTAVSQQPKHTARDMYIVTAASPDNVTAQKVLHPLVSGSTKIMSKSYKLLKFMVLIIHV